VLCVVVRLCALCKYCTELIHIELMHARQRGSVVIWHIIPALHRTNCQVDDCFVSCHYESGLTPPKPLRHWHSHSCASHLPLGILGDPRKDPQYPRKDLQYHPWTIISWHTGFCTHYKWSTHKHVTLWQSKSCPGPPLGIVLYSNRL